jgi:hypothetical protein
MDRENMMEESGNTWICHICDFTSSSTESRACSICYKIACSLHLKTVTEFNAESGLYELLPVCVVCAMRQ